MREDWIPHAPAKHADLQRAIGATAQAVSLGAKAGTTGIGIEAGFRMNESLNLRLGYYGLDYSTDLEEEGIEYDGDLRLRNAALFADWHPFRGNFRLSSGAVQTGNEFVGSAAGELEVGDNTCESTVEAKVDWDGMAPYLGVGYGNAMRGRRWSFALDVGGHVHGFAARTPGRLCERPGTGGGVS